MIIDLRKLYTQGKLDIAGLVKIPEELYLKMDILDMPLVNVKGTIELNYEQDILINLDVLGSFTLPCSITLERVECPFKATIEETIAETDLKDDFHLDLLNILWENIVLEVPLKVVKEGIEVKNISEEHWKLITED